MGKQFFLFLVSVLFSINLSFAQNDDMPKVDTVVNYYKNGKKAAEGPMLWGSETGHWKYWDKQGRLVQETDFINGIIHGKLIYYYLNGKKQNEGSFKYGKKNGLYTEWYENGQKKQMLIFGK